MSDNRTRQRAFATCVLLLALPVPDTTGWCIDYNGVLTGMLASDPQVDLDAARLGMHQWAAVLTNPVWTLEPHGNSRDTHKLAIVGTCLGQRVEIWHLVTGAEGVDVADLAAPPELDAVDAVDDSEMSGRYPQLMLGGEL